MSDWENARNLLETDRVWGAYALADLDPAYRENTDIWHTQTSLLLRYRGLNPPVLFTLGVDEEVDPLIRLLPAGAYQYTLPESHRRGLEDLLLVRHEAEMSRMSLIQLPEKRLESGDAQRLGPADKAAVHRLIKGHADAPDAFHPDQLKSESFFGVWQDGDLVSMAGTHVLSKKFNVAAVGNVFTHPDFRGCGFARAASSAVLADLSIREIETIVLNVHPDNYAAVHLYRELGFQDACRYIEGVGELSNNT